MMETSRRSRRTRDSKSAKTRVWSDNMSPEAKIAMELAIEDTRALKLEEEERLRRQEIESGQANNNNNKSPTRVAFADEQNATTNTAPVEDKNIQSGNRKTSFSELYDRNGSARMRRDITDEQYDEESEPRKALGGGKVESTMELIEFVNRDKPEDSATLDEKAIEELARINSVDKCAVWMEATQDHLTTSGGSDSPQPPPEDGQT